MQRYCWRVLPQGTDNSPALCQKSLAWALQPICDKYLKAYIIYYMDDILLSHQNEELLLSLFQEVVPQLEKWGLTIAPENVRKQHPFSYLGYIIEGWHIPPQKLQIRSNSLKNLNDFQKLLGDINWIQPH